MRQKLPQQRALRSARSNEAASQDSNDEISVVAEIAELFF